MLRWLLLVPLLAACQPASAPVSRHTLAASKDDTRSWERRSFTGGPAARFGHHISWAGEGKILVIGGTPADDGRTWEWDGQTGTWTSYMVAAPQQARDGGAALTYDSGRKRVLMFGGNIRAGSAFNVVNELWEWDRPSRQWRRITPSGSELPAARASAGFAYDPRLGKTLLFSGSAPESPGSISSKRLTDTWELNGTTWTPLKPVSTPGSAEAMFYHPTLGRVVVVSGANFMSVYSWDGQDWFRNSGAGVDMSGQPAISYAGSGRIVVFGGYVQENTWQKAVNDTWEWDGSAWLKVTTFQVPSPREVMEMVYDESRDRAVVFGGRSFPPPPGGDLDVRGDLWEYGITNATLGSPCDPLTASRCASGKCVDGICCEVASCAACQACNVSGREGRCAPLDPLPLACRNPGDASVPAGPRDGGGGAAGTGGTGGVGGTGGASGTGGEALVQDAGSRSDGPSTVRTEAGAEEGEPSTGADAGKAAAGATLYTGPACAFGQARRTGALSLLVSLLLALLVARRRC